MNALSRFIPDDHDTVVTELSGPPFALPPYDEDEAAGPVVRRSRAKRYDWDLAARLLAQGCPAGIVAARLGCSRRSVFRALQRAPGLRSWIAQERRRTAAEAASQLQGLRRELADTLARLALEGNPRVLCFLARELKLTEGDYAAVETEAVAE